MLSWQLSQQSWLLAGAAAADGGVDAAAGRVAVDLDSLAFARGSHLMSNKKTSLPEGSFRTNFKVRHSGYSMPPACAGCSGQVTCLGCWHCKFAAVLSGRA